jgi:hypothetical protein
MAPHAGRRGARVLAGSCRPGDAVPGHRPWIQVVRNLARTATPDEWTAAAATTRPIAVVLDDLRGPPRPRW